MKRNPSPTMLAVDLCTRGVAYAVFHGPHTLVDYGIRKVPGPKNPGSLKEIRELALWYVPDVLVLEDCAAPTCRKRDRIKRLARQVSRLAQQLQVPTQPIRWSLVRLVVGKSVKANKHAIARRLCEAFPELLDRLPPQRQVFNAEDLRMNIFDAVALGVTAQAISRSRIAA